MQARAVIHCMEARPASHGCRPAVHLTARHNLPGTVPQPPCAPDPHRDPGSGCVQLHPAQPRVHCRPWARPLGPPDEQVAPVQVTVLKLAGLLRHPHRQGSLQQQGARQLAGQSGRGGPQRGYNGTGLVCEQAAGDGFRLRLHTMGVGTPRQLGQRSQPGPQHRHAGLLRPLCWCTTPSPAAGWTALPQRSAAGSAPGRRRRRPPQTPAQAGRQADSQTVSQSVRPAAGRASRWWG